MSEALLKEIKNGRSVVIDLEMTGIPLSDGHRVVSIGLVELINAEQIGEKREYFVNPERPNNPRAYEMHGLSDEFLAEQPLFKAYAEEILAFIGTSPLVHHCWYGENDHSVDEDFFEMEMQRAGYDTIPHDRWINMKKWAQMISTDANSLNNMLDQFEVDRSGREGVKGHGALDDAELTAQLYPRIYKHVQTNYPNNLEP